MPAAMAVCLMIDLIRPSFLIWRNDAVACRRFRTVLSVMAVPPCAARA
jgi:hypothetical protein